MKSDFLDLLCEKTQMAMISMSTPKIIPVMLFCCVSLFAQSTVELESLRKIPPPNCLHLYDSTYMDETEIANIHWVEYLYYLAKDSSNDFYLSQLPDSVGWSEWLATKDTFDAYEE